MNLRDTILAAEDLKTESVEVPEWGITVHVRSLTAVERDAYDASMMGLKDLPVNEKLRIVRDKLLVLCVVDEKGDHVFTDDDIDEIGKKSAKAVNRLFDAAQVLNATSEKEIEEIAGN